MLATYSPRIPVCWQPKTLMALYVGNLQPPMFLYVGNIQPLVALYDGNLQLSWPCMLATYSRIARIGHQDSRIGHQNRTPRIGHQADQERLGYSNYTKPTRIGHQADQEMLGYSN